MGEAENISQNVIIEGRKKLHISGVKEVCSFDDETLVLSTVLGKMTVKGEALHIESFNAETGDLSAAGRIHAAVYMADGKSGGGVLRGLFR